jgi:hypothetical protein
MGGGIMRLLRFAGVGIVIWGLSWIWPQLNQMLAPSVMIGMILGLAATTLAYLLIQRLDYRVHDNGTVEQDHPSHPTPITATR